MRWLRSAALGAAAVALCAGFMLFAYELRAARVPQHRAALEALVRAQTGLNLRFDELALRWGWYGPEAVFSRVELGTPGQAAVLLRAPELVVSFDPWRTLQSGRLQVGRITLIAPDIDLPRIAAPLATTSAVAASGSGNAILSGWRDGRVDIEGGTLRIAAAGQHAEAVVLALRHAFVYRANSQWSAQAFVLLPERLGTSARIDLRMRGDLNDAKSLSGNVRFEGPHLAFAGWRELLQDAPQLASFLPAAGAGDLIGHAEFSAGRLDSAAGSVQAGGVEFAGALPSAQRLRLDEVRGDFRLRRRGASWHAEIDGLEVGGAGREAAASDAHVEADVTGASVHASATILPLASLAALGAWFAPQLNAGMQFAGSAADVQVDWDAHRQPGARLLVSAKLENIGFATASHAFALSGLDGRISGDERTWRIDLEGRAARLELAEHPQEPLQDLDVASHLLVSRTDRGLQLATDGLYLKHDGGRLRISGNALAPTADAPLQLQLQGELADADVMLLRKLGGADLAAHFGPAVSRLKAGRIEDARFTLTRGGIFSGSLALKDAVVSDAPGLDAEGVDARIDWNDTRITAWVEKGRAGPLQLGPLQLQWRADGQAPIQIDGHAAGALENTLSWVSAHPQLRGCVPDVATLTARGEALFDFDFAVLPDGSTRTDAAHGRTHARIAISLEGATVLTGPGVPPLEAVRGSLAFDGGHLQRSLLTARWLGGPVSLHVAERSERHTRVFAVKAQGLLDVRKLAALGTFADPDALSGDAEWNGDFLLTPDSRRHRARWQGRLDATLTGVTSRLPEPLTKAAGIAAPLHIDVAGSAERAELRFALADRLHSVFEISAVGDNAWRVERGSVRFGGSGPVSLAAEPAVVLSGKLARLELSPYIATWNRERRDVVLPPVSGAVFVSELLAAGDIYADAHLKVRRGAAGLDLQMETPTSGRRPGI
ncbi:MAG TPA: DUF3971 domain-containing protein [Steroidobacteraceae bacterium]